MGKTQGWGLPHYIQSLQNTSMSKKKRAKTKSKAKKSTSSARRKKSTSMQLEGYFVTSGPILEAKDLMIPIEVREQMDALHGLIQSNPEAALPQLLDLIQDYPDIPKLYNYLSVVYLRLGDEKRVDELVVETYQRFPDYLFARINYAESYMRQENYAKVMEIFDYKVDIKSLYPERTHFHITEFMSFKFLMGRYFIGVGEMELAKIVHSEMQQVDSDSIQTLNLGLLLMKDEGFFQQTLAKLFSLKN